MSSEIIRDGSVAGGIPQIPPFRPTVIAVFAERAQRLGELAPGHALEEYLRFAAALCQAQDQVSRGFPKVALPDARTLAQCREHGLPPLSADGHRRDGAWREGLRQLLAALERAALPSQATAVVSTLEDAPADRLEALASHLLAGAYAEVDAGQAPFVGAALQVYWTSMAAALGAEAFGPNVRYGLCPACGSPPVASIVRIGGALQGLRYLQCSLCASEWHVVRVKCSACASTKGISYLGIEGASEAIKAEVCAECKTYLKIFYLEKDPRIEPGADDLASLALDLLVDEQNYRRVGPNLLFAVKSEG
jgi:FdhE protein